MPKSGSVKEEKKKVRAAPGMALMAEKFDDGTKWALAKVSLGKQPTTTNNLGCTLLNRKGNKGKGKDGYVQVGGTGVQLCSNFVAFFQHMSLRQARRALKTGFHVSHLCGNSKCVNVEHLVYESALENNSRKNCCGVSECSKCGHKMRTCSHTPVCLPVRKKADCVGECPKKVDVIVID
jgi:hypothetical protein